MTKPICADCGAETVDSSCGVDGAYECPRCDPPDDGVGPMKSVSQLAAEQLMRAAGQEVRETPGEPSEETRLLRAKLILEEAFETVEALGVRVTDLHDNVVRPSELSYRAEFVFDLIESVDGCCDLNVVVAGTLSALGVPDEPVQAEVEESNRSKLLYDGTLPPHPTVPGKFGKGPNYHAPGLKRVLDSIFEQRIGGEA